MQGLHQMIHVPVLSRLMNLSFLSPSLSPPSLVLGLPMSAGQYLVSLSLICSDEQ